MQIKFGEGDGYLYEDGKDRNIILTIENKQMIIPTDKTIAELCEIIKKTGIQPTRPPIVQPGLNSQEKVPIVEAFASDKIQYNDYVKFIGKSDSDNADLVSGEEYRVINITKDTYDLISDKAPFPIRLVVAKNEVILSRKNPPPSVERKNDFEQMVVCDECKTENVLILDETQNKYIGNCINCKKSLEVERIVE